MSAKVFVINKTLSKHYLLKIEESRSGKSLHRSRAGSGDIKQYTYQTSGLQKRTAGPK